MMEIVSSNLPRPISVTKDNYDSGGGEEIHVQHEYDDEEVEPVKLFFSSNNEI